MLSEERRYDMSHAWQSPGYDPVTVSSSSSGALGTGVGGVVWGQRTKDLAGGLIMGMADE
jgi:hypothetical protein